MIWPTKNLTVCAIKHTAMHLLVVDSVITGLNTKQRHAVFEIPKQQKNWSWSTDKH